MPVVSPDITTPHRHHNRLVESNAKILQLMELAKAKGLQRLDVAAEIGISASHLSQLINGNEQVSRVIDRAAEAIIRRFGQPLGTNGPKLIIARIAIAHWPTISLWVKGMHGEIVDEFHALLTDDANTAPEFVVAILYISERHSEAVKQFIISTSGEVKKVI